MKHFQLKTGLVVRHKAEAVISVGAHDERSIDVAGVNLTKRKGPSEYYEALIFTPVKNFKFKLLDVVASWEE